MKRSQQKASRLPSPSLVNALCRRKTTSIPPLSYRHNISPAKNPKQQAQDEAIETRKIGMAARLSHLLVCPRKLSVVRLEWPFKNAEIIKGLSYWVLFEPRHLGMRGARFESRGRRVAKHSIDLGSSSRVAKHLVDLASIPRSHRKGSCI